MGSWNGVVAPESTPAPIIERLYAALKAVLETREVQDTFARNDTLAIGSSPAEFAATIAIEVTCWNTAVARMGIQPE